MFNIPINTTVCTKSSVHIPSTLGFQSELPKSGSYKLIFCSAIVVESNCFRIYLKYN